jgi:hypothetical protein
VVRLEGTAYERHERKSELFSWSDLAATTDADGAFTLRFDPPSPLKFRLVAKAPGHAEVTWNWSAIGAGEIKDLGDIQLRVGATVVGRLVDRAGRALPGKWNGLRSFRSSKRFAAVTLAGARILRSISLMSPPVARWMVGDQPAAHLAREEARGRDTIIRESGCFMGSDLRW